MEYLPARWLPTAHAMTIVGALHRPFARPRMVRERWELPDGDFLDVDRAAAPVPDAPVLVVCHGLEASSRAAYVRGLVQLARRRGLAAVAMNFRSCSGTPNRLPRFYHSGETGDLAYVVERLAAERPGRAIALCGFSLGGNVIAKYLGERGEGVPAEVAGAAVISVPFDLARCARALDGPGFWKWVYRERFLAGLRVKALEKARRFPGILDVGAIRAARTFSAFDAAVTAPLHGFASAEDYWERCSSGRFVAGVRRPLLALSALDDPLVPADSLPLGAARGNPYITLVTTPVGGHVGFVSGSPLRPSYWSEARAVGFVAELVGAPTPRASGSPPRPRSRAPCARTARSASRRR
jgi:predicted alpha/beta-fold hydrolase